MSRSKPSLTWEYVVVRSLVACAFVFVIGYRVGAKLNYQPPCDEGAQLEQQRELGELRSEAELLRGEVDRLNRENTELFRAIDLKETEIRTANKWLEAIRSSGRGAAGAVGIPGT